MRWLIGSVLICLPWSASPALARPPYKHALVRHFGPLLATKLNDCRTCHVPGPADVTGTEAKPHNSFGERLRRVKRPLREEGKSTDVIDRITAIADEDSDGDGASNLLELLAGTNPGEAEDHPSAVELERARDLVAALQERHAGYRWRPFEPVTRPAVPGVKNASWVRNPIDAFVAAEHEAHGLAPRPEAPKAVLLRRIHVDLTGLPPTPGELQAFLADESPDAYEKVVDELLARPQHGERWARHWMDTWRYSDWAGFGAEVRDSQPHVWRWRDWIVDSLNADKAYDRMIVEMLAGDEVAPEDPDVLRATGFLVRNYKRYSRERWLQDAVDHVFMAFQGVTMNCARCHDHVYDPILQREYFQVRAIFAPHNQRIDRLPGHVDVNQVGLARAFDAEPNVQTFLLVRGDDRTPDKTPLDPGVPELLGVRGFQPVAVPLPKGAYAPDKRDFVYRDLLQESTDKYEAARQALAAARRQNALAILRALTPADAWSRLAALTPVDRLRHDVELAELDVSIAATRRLALQASLRAEKLEEEGKKDSEDWTLAAQAASEAQRKVGVLEAKKNLAAVKQSRKLAPPPQRSQADEKVREAEKQMAAAEARHHQPPTTDFTRRNVATYPAQSTGRRLAFARWLGDPQNPLTARVAMNHVWLRHFGEAIVPSVFDFGGNGRQPSHPALLDWLAIEFMDPSWRVERGEPSARPASSALPAALHSPRHQGWSMKAMHRLIVTSNTYRQASTPDAGMVARDPDNRYLWRMAPRRVEAEVVRDAILFVSGQLDQTRGGPDIDHQQGLSVPRRSLYFRHAAEKQMEFLKLFDLASTSECYQRKESILPQQALALANSELTINAARVLAAKLHGQVGQDGAAFVRAAFEHVLSRPATHEELLECVAFLNDRVHAGADGDVLLRARQSLLKVLFNHHDFVTLR